MTKRTALVDGDLLLHKIASANEEPIRWSDWLWTLHADFATAAQQVDDDLEKIATHLHADGVIIALTDGANWRKSVLPTYKANRVNTRKPVIYHALREYVLEKHRTYLRPTLEADDILGILATHPTLVKGEKIVVSDDKDMKTIPGLHCKLSDATVENPPHITRVDVAKADCQHMMQTLTGDVTDGYSGCPGIGPKKAEKILDGCWSAERDDFTVEGAFEEVLAAYIDAGLTYDDALQNARVARILRAEDYDFQKKEVKLWNPKSPSLAPRETAKASPVTTRSAA